jgi:hypothetical protein
MLDTAFRLHAQPQRVLERSHPIRSPTAAQAPDVTLMTQRDTEFWLPALAAAGGVIVAVMASYFGGFLGIGIAGLVIGFASVRYDLEKQDVGGGFPSAVLYRKQVAVREEMTAEERMAHRASLRALWQPLAIAKTISIGLIALGFGGYLFL